MFLIIKGSIAEAIQSAMIRGINLIGEMESVANSIYCHCDASHVDAVVRWFCESSECKSVTGYDSGVLLFYR